MSKKSWHYIAAVIVVCLVFLALPNNDAFAQTYPETIRVGLYFGSASASSVALSAKSGIEAGYYKDNEFTALLTEKGGAQLIFRKDAHFIKSSSGAISEYNPNEGLPFYGETYGPYHIQIGDKAADLASAQKLCSDYRLWLYISGFGMAGRLDWILFRLTRLIRIYHPGLKTWYSLRLLINRLHE